MISPQVRITRSSGGRSFVLSVNTTTKEPPHCATLAVKNLDQTSPVRRKDAGCARGGVGKIGIGGIIGRIQKIVSKRGGGLFAAENSDVRLTDRFVVADDVNWATRLGAVRAI